MKSIVYRNLDITFPDDTNLLKNKNEVNNLFRKLDSVFDNMHTKASLDVYSNNYATAVRLNGHKDKLIVQIFKSGKHNSYLHYYNPTNRQLTNKIPYDVISIFNNEFMFGDLKDKSDNITNPSYCSMIDIELQTSIIDAATKYDETNEITMSLSHRNSEFDDIT